MCSHFGDLWGSNLATQELNWMVEAYIPVWNAWQICTTAETLPSAVKLVQELQELDKRLATPPKRYRVCRGKLKIIVG